ncbi:hypothetical protein HII31_02988 [Pseudocercospora fuligena]|uniref:NAD dependent epimerase/dehydratase n=1 Tax=Pseudocercospora fuligena TaxID=685502 RepID=A0A8H6VL23_9PEZI|nr:hypothetical protein HII31_02988 [Pseudocercospora fuligena]
MSLWDALKRLGYTPYHFKEVSKPDNIRDRHVLCWRAAFYAKLYGSGEPYGKAEFDKLLSRYDAVTDAPAVNFSSELIAAYPEAKVILSKRDPEKWLESTQRSYHAVIESPVFRMAAVVDVPLSILGELFELVLRDWTGGDWRNRAKMRQAYEAHNDQICSLVPTERLLEWEPRDGWEPICEFLGKNVPEEVFPHSNKGDDVSRGVLLAARLRIGKWAFRKTIVPLGLIGTVFGGWIVLSRPAAWKGAVNRCLSFLRDSIQT